jgi:ribosome-binding ATPase YchF (GTP1/OBG family)
LKIEEQESKSKQKNQKRR